jgi:hypothetical protein
VREVYKRSVIRLGYPTKNLTIPAGTNRTCRLANLHDAEKVRTLIRENIEGLKTIMEYSSSGWARP